MLLAYPSSFLGYDTFYSGSKLNKKYFELSFSFFGKESAEDVEIGAVFFDEYGE